MKLYLSSIGVPNKQALLKLVSKDKPSVAIIPNAWDVYPEGRRKEEMVKCRKTFIDIGFDVKRVDIKSYTGDELRTELQKHDLVWLMGGNSFYLNELVHKSGFFNVIEDLVSNGLIYGGESAGAVLAGSTLDGVDELDDPGKASKIIRVGLGLVDFGIVPHWGMEKYTDALERCKTEMEKYAKVRVLTNEQALVVNDGDVKLIEK